MGQVSSSKSSNTTANASILEKPEEIEVDYESISPRFSVDNLEDLQQGVEYLNEHGYAIFSDVHSNDEITNSIDLLWKFLENLEPPYHIRRNNPETWNKPWPGLPHFGLLNEFDIGQSEFLWSIRGNPNVKKVFSQIWNSNELFVSFDGAGGFRNWHLNQKWKTSGGWYHCDQNPFKKPNRCSIQGLVSLTDSDETTGGLVVLPDSHKYFLELQSTIEKRRLHGDFVRVPYEHPLLEKLSPRLIKCKAGDLILWDSRCIHCNTPALVYKEKPNQPEFLRLAAYVCMSPISLFVPDEISYKTIEEFRELRKEFVREGITCSHWPLELIAGSRRIQENKMPLKLNAFQNSLIIGTNVEAENGTEEEFIF